MALPATPGGIQFDRRDSQPAPFRSDGNAQAAMSAHPDAWGKQIPPGPLPGLCFQLRREIVPQTVPPLLPPAAAPPAGPSIGYAGNETLELGRSTLQIMRDFSAACTVRRGTSTVSGTWALGPIPASELRTGAVAEGRLRLLCSRDPQPARCVHDR